MSANLTESDRSFLEKAIFCLKTPPDLDVAKMAEVLGIKPKSVTNRWCEIKKIYADLPGELSSNGATRKRKAKVTDDFEGSSPAKLARPASAKKPRTTVQEETAELNAIVKKEEQAEHEANLKNQFQSAPLASGGDEEDYEDDMA
ncbi:hypothetical protein GQ53DRAFT_763653 [Thozetella sp. PMI_491]|nr:hypothetical protein GQ53DRAFT_763653 [Thozetella sp. PMI_491]